MTTAQGMLLLTCLLLLSGCGENVSQKLARENSEAIAKDQDREIMKLQDRIQELEKRR